MTSDGALAVIGRAADCRALRATNFIGTRSQICVAIGRARARAQRNVNTHARTRPDSNKRNSFDCHLIGRLRARARTFVIDRRTRKRFACLVAQVAAYLRASSCSFASRMSLNACVLSFEIGCRKRAGTRQQRLSVSRMLINARLRTHTQNNAIVS